MRCRACRSEWARLRGSQRSANRSGRQCCRCSSRDSRRSRRRSRNIPRSHARLRRTPPARTRVRRAMMRTPGPPWTMAAAAAARLAESAVAAATPTAAARAVRAVAATVAAASSSLRRPAQKLSSACAHRLRSRLHPPHGPMEPLRAHCCTQAARRLWPWPRAPDSPSPVCPLAARFYTSPLPALLSFCAAAAASNVCRCALWLAIGAPAPSCATAEARALVAAQLELAGSNGFSLGGKGGVLRHGCDGGGGDGGGRRGEQAHGEGPFSLSALVLRGVGLHHAGLPRTLLAIVEGAYLRGVLTTVCATSTLAAGINLPAATVRATTRPNPLHEAFLCTLPLTTSSAPLGLKGGRLTGFGWGGRAPLTSTRTSQR